MERIQKLRLGGQEVIHRELPSRAWQPMRLRHDAHAAFHGYEDWENCFYEARVERFSSGSPIGGGPYVRIGVCNIDQTARHDFRDFQRIKNDICGDEWEAIELYPSESRLVDPSNYFYLWCVPPGVLEVGFFTGRNVLDMEEATLAPQRPFPRAGK